MKQLTLLVVFSLFFIAWCGPAHADSIAVLRQGLLGAGTGAVATAASGARGDAVWRGALVGAGVNVVGGALLDVLTGDGVRTVTYVRNPQPVTVVVPARRPTRQLANRRIYRTGFRNGYRQGYMDGYIDGRYNY